MKKKLLLPIGFDEEPIIQKRNTFVVNATSRPFAVQQLTTVSSSRSGPGLGWADSRAAVGGHARDWVFEGSWVCPGRSSGCHDAGSVGLGGLVLLLLLRRPISNVVLATTLTDRPGGGHRASRRSHPAMASTSHTSSTYTSRMSATSVHRRKDSARRSWNPRPAPVMNPTTTVARMTISHL